MGRNKKRAYGKTVNPVSSKMAGLTRLELATSGVTGRRSNQLNYNPAILFFVQWQYINGGRNRARTCDPRLVRPVLSQLSYSPFVEYPTV
jgi:ubiquitin